MIPNKEMKSNSNTKSGAIQTMLANKADDS